MDRIHVAVNVHDVARSRPFYEALFGVAPAKVKADYVKFETPLVNFTLNRSAAAGSGALDHLGFQVGSTAQVLAARDRLEASGLAPWDEMDTTCCYARQDKVWVTDPDGIRWEVFTVLEDADEPEPAQEACC